MVTIYLDGIEYRPYSNLYAVSACGKVLRNMKPYTPPIRSDGYASIGRQKLLHRVVATLWCNKPINATQVHHINHNKLDNRSANLEWLSAKEHLSDKHKDARAGYKVSDATKQKLRDYRTGKKTSEATKQKQREASLKLGCKPPPRKVGTKMPIDSIEKMRKNSPNAKGCVINGIEYPSFSAAGRALGKKPHTLRKRCLADTFPLYRVRESDSSKELSTRFDL